MIQIPYSFRPSRVSKTHSFPLEIHAVHCFFPLSVTHCRIRPNFTSHIRLKEISLSYAPSDKASTRPLPSIVDVQTSAPCSLNSRLSSVRRLLQLPRLAISKRKNVEDNYHAEKG